MLNTLRIPIPSMITSLHSVLKDCFCTKPFSFQMLSVLRETSAVSLKVACALLHINLVYGESCAQGAEGHAAFYQVVKSYRL